MGRRYAPAVTFIPGSSAYQFLVGTGIHCSMLRGPPCPNTYASNKQLLQRSKSRIFQREHQDLIINLGEIFVAWNPNFFS